MSKCLKWLQKKQLHIKQYVFGKHLKTIITMTNNLTDMILDDIFMPQLREGILLCTCQSGLSVC